MIPFWFWFLTATVALGAIAISSYVVIFMKLAELDKAERSKAAARRIEMSRHDTIPQPGNERKSSITDASARRFRV